MVILYYEAEVSKNAQAANMGFAARFKWGPPTPFRLAAFSVSLMC